MVLEHKVSATPPSQARRHPGIGRFHRRGTFDFRYLDRTQGNREVAFYHTQVGAVNLTPAIEAVREQMEQAARAYTYNLDGTDTLFNK